jgi:hypothetical protein
MSGAYVRGFWTQVPVSDDFAIRSYVRGFWTHCPWVTDGILFLEGAQPCCPALVDPFRRIEQHTIPIYEIVGWRLAGIITVGQTVARRFTLAARSQVSALHHDNKAVVFQLFEPRADRVFVLT